MMTRATTLRSIGFFVATLLLSSSAQAQFGGTGEDGIWAPTGNATLDPDEGGASGRNGEFHFTSFYVPEGTTTTIGGPYNGPATKIFVQGDVVIDGRLFVNHGCSMGERHPGNIGYPGSCNCNHAAHSILGPGDSTPYNSEYLQLPLGGASGYPFDDNHRGGGFVEIEAGGSILIAGGVEANGINRGAGGAISLRSRELTYLAPLAYLHAHSGDRDNGYIRIESSASVVLEGETRPLAVLDGRQRMLGEFWSASRLAGDTLARTESSGLQEVHASRGGGFGVAQSLRGAVWVSFPDIDEIHPYGRNGLDLLPGKVIHAGGGASPRGLAVDRLDRIWVACGGSNRLHYYDAAGRRRLDLGVGVAPYAVAVDGDGDCWLTCTGAGRLYQYQINGTQLLDLDIGPGPRGLAVDAEGNVWVAMAGSLEATQGFVQKFSQEGDLLGTYEVGLRPNDVAIDGHGRVWVANEGDLLTDPGSTVTALDSNGTLIGTYAVGVAPNSISVGGDGSIWVVNGGTPFAPASDLMQLDPDTGEILSTVALPDRSIAFGDPFGSKAFIAHDPQGDADGDDAMNYYELAEGGDPFNPSLTPTSDCNGNGIPDVDDIGTVSEDCNGNSVPDECDILTTSGDCNSNGIPDECDVSFGGASTDCNDNGVPDECDVASNGALDLNGNGVMDACECVSQSYCSSNPNSTGVGALLVHSGTLSCALNNLTLITTNCPPDRFGIYFYGSGQINQPFGEGKICTASPYVRLPLVYTGPNGIGACAVNLNAPQLPGLEIDPEETWNFQFWFRDEGGAFNTSNALELTFCD